MELLKKIIKQILIMIWGFIAGYILFVPRFFLGILIFFILMEFPIIIFIFIILILISLS